MAKEPSQTRLPCLNNGSRIPSVSRATKPGKSTKSFGHIGLRAQTSSLLPKSLSSEKVCQASTLVRKTFVQNRLVKPNTKNTTRHLPSAVVGNENMETFTTDKNQTKTIQVSSSNGPSGLLTRSETFIRDVDDTIHPSPKDHTHVIDESNNLNNTNIFNETLIAMSTSTPNNLTMSQPNSSNSLVDKTTKLDISGHIINSTMCTRLLDVTEISPTRLFNLNESLENKNLTTLLYMSTNEDLNKTLVPGKSQHCSEEVHMDVDESPESVTVEQQAQTMDAAIVGSATAITGAQKPRFSFGLDLTDCTLDCSIELVDSSVTSSAPLPSSPSCQLKKQNSFEMDESLGILTPDQMKEFLDSTTNTNVDLPLQFSGKHSLHQCRVDQTPSPEELPLDTVAVKTDMSDCCAMACDFPNIAQPLNYHQEQQFSQTDSYSKTDQMIKSGTSKVSNSFITSITSITSLDTGYQGDGEMSRPASRGGDHSPSSGPRMNGNKHKNLIREPSFANQNQNIPIVRRQDVMTDSDFFTESDADDIFHRGDRRAQIIDGQLYGPMMHEGANVFVDHQQPAAEDSCMESSGIFTDVENRCEEYHPRTGCDSDMSPDGSTDTIKSNNTEYSKKIATLPTTSVENNQGQCMSDSTASSINSNSSCCEKGGPRPSVISHDSVSVSSIQSNQTFSNLNETNLHSATTKTKKNSLSRKQNKNEANVALKKHEMSKRVSVTAGKLKSNSLGTNIVTGTSSVVGLSTVVNCDKIENQENKRPSTGQSGNSRKTVPNKWDAVMNKIAQNKSITKTVNYSEVKSKVTSSIRSSPKIFNNSTNDGQQVPSPSASKRPLSNLTKRGRTHSKDSQQSSQSDLSLACGSPKQRPTSSTNPRSAKKRDVRTISISPTDLRSPLKTGENSKTINIKPILIQKSTTPNGNGNAAASRIDTKNSTSTKKITPKRIASTSSGKTPFKDQNNLLNSTASSPKGTLSPQSTLKNNVTTLPLSQTTAATTSLNRNGDIHLDRVIQKLQSNSNQNDRIENNVKLPNCLDSDASTITKKSNEIDLNLIHANKGVEALGVLIQYLAFNLDAFNTPYLKIEYENTKKALCETKVLLDDVRLACNNFEEQLTEKDEYYGIREKDLQELHTCELKKAEDCFNQLEQTYKSRILSLEEKLDSYVEKLKTKEIEFDSQVEANKDKEIELLKRISTLSSTENELRDKVHASEKQFGERLRTAANRERELIEKINELTKQLEQNKKDADDKERNLNEKLHLSQDELVVLRSSKNSTDLEQPLSPSILSKPRMLKEEIESLRCVLELKQREISDLRKSNNELQTQADALPNSLLREKALESRLEDLQIQLDGKTSEEKELLAKNKYLQESLAHEVKYRNRLCLHNEELQWKLKQNSEKFSLVLTELSKSYQDHSDALNESKLGLYGLDISSERSNGSDKFNECFHMEDLSPPTSPVVKGVVEKTDSVSWVLEINDDESAEAMANRMVKRAGSFRSSFNEKSPGLKRQLPHALSQSASATSVLRQHSEVLQTPHSKQSNTRIRSKSVSVKPSEPKKIIGSNTSANRKAIDVASSWNERLCSVSPSLKRTRHASTTKDKTNSKDLLLSEESETEQTVKVRSRSNSISNDDPFTNFKRNHSYKPINNKRGLITCNTADLVSKQRTELCPSSLPTHPSVQDLKKCQQIKESAGEAMVSGTNSEDEEASSSSSSSSSDDCVSSVSSRSSSLHSDRRHHCRRPSNDELLQKLGASRNSTPMEVSWSEDADTMYPNESVV